MTTVKQDQLRYNVVRKLNLLDGYSKVELCEFLFNHSKYLIVTDLFEAKSKKHGVISNTFVRLTQQESKKQEIHHCIRLDEVLHCYPLQ